MVRGRRELDLLGDPRLRGVLRDVDRRLPQRLRRTARVVTGRARVMRRAPLVTVVVAGPADATGLSRSLDALRVQEHRNLEVLVMVDGRSSPVAAVLARHAAEDWRIHVRGGSTTTAAARNAAASSARGTYLAFVRSGDVLPTASLALLVSSLESSGSDFAFGRLQEMGALHRDVASVVPPAHEQNRVGVSLEEFPEAVTDTHDENRIYRTAFWRSRGLAFAEGDSTSAPALRAFADAGSFDVLADPTYHRHQRATGRPIGALHSAIDDLDDWLGQQSTMQVFLSRSDVPAMEQAWGLSVCDFGAVPFLDDAERASDEQWKRLRDMLASTHDLMDAETWEKVRAESRVKVWLAVHDHREALERFVAARLFEFGNRRTDVAEGRVLARFGGLEQHLVASMPEECFEMGERETALRVHLQSVRWRDETHLELGVFAFAPFVGYADTAPEVTAVLHGPGGQALPLTVEAGRDPEVNVLGGHRYQDYSRGATTVVVDADQLPEAVPGEDPVSWSFAFEVTTRGLTRRGSFTSREGRTSAGYLTHPLLSPRVVGDRLVAVRPGPGRGVTLSVGPVPPVRLTGCRTEGRVLHGTLAGVATGTMIATLDRGGRASAPLRDGPDGSCTFELRLPPAPRIPEDERAPRGWTVRLRNGREERPITLPVQLDGRMAGAGTPAEILPARDPSGHLIVVETSAVLVLSSVTLTEGALRLRGRWPGPGPVEWHAAMRTRRAEVTVTGTSVDGEFEADLPTVWDEWGLGESSIPPGTYTIRVSSPGAPGTGEVRLVLDGSLLQQLMKPTVNATFRMSPVATTWGFAVRLNPPLADDERGPFAQRSLQLWSAGDELPIDEKAVYLQSYTGSSATDSQRAIHDELRSARPDLTLYWAVASSATQVPEGGVPLLMHSREWYRVLGSAKYLVNNIDFDRWFRTKPGQRFLQTFHGYPAKSMGIRLWKAKQFTPRRIGLELDRTSRDWSLILTPTPEMDRYYRVEYAYDGEIENAGYPRDDALLAPDRDEVRERTRRLLGIRSDQTAVLYAPTWRDDQATNYRSARMTKHLDLESATAHLGEEYVFLMRGHRFHTQVTDRSRTARLVDVTDYPEVNDLILAADAAVLDYSSMRFDFALTGRPMLFLVPDLRAYTGGVRGFLYPFEDSAPGPLLEDAEDVIRELRRLPAVAREYAEAYERFQQRYNYLQDGHAAARVVARFFD